MTNYSATVQDIYVPSQLRDANACMKTSDVKTIEKLLCVCLSL